jgi:hypothetical protein
MSAVEKNKYTLNLSNIRTKIRTYQEQGKDVLLSAIFITGREKSKLIDKAPVKQLSLITKNLKCENPDKIRIELFDGKETVNPLWLKEIILSLPENEEEPTEFKGLGEADINRIVDERFQERQRLAEYELLKERVLELTEENEELQDKIDELVSNNSQLETDIESKKQIKYYAGMLGDILESFGIAKNTVKRPLAELMGISDESDSPKQLQGKNEDSSGIVEKTGEVNSFSPEEQKRNEVIILISDYLKTTSNQTLANIFSIFSAIEADNSVAEKILLYLTPLKSDSNAKV